MYSLLFDYLISIISFAQELTLLAYVFVIASPWRSFLVPLHFRRVILSWAPYTYSTWWIGG